MRRRLLLGKGNGELKLSSTGTTVAASNGSTSVYIYEDSTIYSGETTILCNESWVTVTNNNGSVTISFTSNIGNAEHKIRTATIYFTALDQTVTFKLTQNYVDANITSGLPDDGENNNMPFVKINGLCWANFNVGGGISSSFYNYYQEGNYYKYGAGTTTGGRDATIVHSGTEDPLDYTVDTAKQVIGVAWRTPTKAEFESLIANTDSKIVIFSVPFLPVKGTKIESKTDSSRFIFIPWAGHELSGSHGGQGAWGQLWSSTPYGSNWAYNLTVGSTENYDSGVVSADTYVGSEIRYEAPMVRGVFDGGVKTQQYDTLLNISNPTINRITVYKPYKTPSESGCRFLSYNYINMTTDCIKLREYENGCVAYYLPSYSGNSSNGFIIESGGRTTKGQPFSFKANDMYVYTPSSMFSRHNFFDVSVTPSTVATSDTEVVTATTSYGLYKYNINGISGLVSKYNIPAKYYNATECYIPGKTIAQIVSDFTKQKCADLFTLTTSLNYMYSSNGDCLRYAGIVSWDATSNDYVINKIDN
jgi:hypothetical protein